MFSCPRPAQHSQPTSASPAEPPTALFSSSWPLLLFSSPLFLSPFPSPTCHKEPHITMELKGTVNNNLHVHLRNAKHRYPQQHPKLCKPQPSWRDAAHNNNYQFGSLGLRFASLSLSFGGALRASLELLSLRMPTCKC